MAYIGRQPTVGNFRICDAISVVNGQAAYTMQVGGVNVIPESANNMIVSLNGVIQKPGSSYTVSSSTITFSSNLSTGDVIDFIQILGGVANIGTPTDGTVTSAKLVYPLTSFSSTGIDDNASSTALTIKSDGKVGIGTTDPGFDFVVKDSSGSATIRAENGNDNKICDLIADATGGLVRTIGSYPLVLNTNQTERMRITGAGRFGMNGRTNPQYTLEFGDSGTGNGWSINAENNVHKIRTRASANDTQTHVQWENTNGIVGTIKTNASATQYNTSSDYRLKENIDYDWDATTRLKQLKPARFNFIADDTNTLVDGFIAHEVSTIVPEAVSGAKDGMIAEVLYEEGDELPEGKNVGDVKTTAQIDPQGIDQSKLVPLLVKTIQELEARITALES